MTSLKDFPCGRVPEFSMMSRKPQLGAYALPKFAEKLKKHNLYPSYSLEKEHVWRLRDQGIDLQLWNGVYKQNGMYCKLDRPMMTKLASIINPNIKENLDKIKKETLLIPKEFRIYQE